MKVTQIINDKGKVVLDGVNWKTIRREWYEMLLNGQIPGYELKTHEE